MLLTLPPLKYSREEEEDKSSTLEEKLECIEE
jgi:hypothetical protein